MAGKLLNLSLAAGAFALVIGFAACGKEGANVGVPSASSSDDGGSTVSAPSSGADTLLEKIAPKDVTDALDALGINYEIQSDPRGYPMIAVDARRFPVQQFSILFFSCDTVQAECDDIALWAWYDKGGAVNEKTIYAWNDPFQARRWSTAYIDKDNDPALVMNINATGGIGQRALQILVNTYVEDLFAFRDLLQSQQTSQNDTSSQSTATGYAGDASGASLVDGDVIEMTNLIKDFGSSSYDNVKEDEQK